MSFSSLYEKAPDTGAQDSKDPILAITEKLDRILSIVSDLESKQTRLETPPEPMGPGTIMSIAFFQTFVSFVSGHFLAGDGLRNYFSPTAKIIVYSSWAVLAIPWYISLYVLWNLTSPADRGLITARLVFFVAFSTFVFSL
ncbi:hypothetical protein BABINDRAFT_162983 [Babjeviella inositovora NRRL Y-12698]|uniref:Uncharacterized protein n=1 Tax=Babjeviella inositovora NRRL Y-12698 TaxID=984486 RepID=A0A1E3QKX0_9ASCO|nr:uncharacterized protein BABINDRAFT_162983 [Babjeviella inositovora NRRL Y-12698]ODQ78346.1 hypothetical protein BABINDRAFT_162983 [Babjeviella inositovora NRRL Y-12698]